MGEKSGYGIVSAIHKQRTQYIKHCIRILTILCLIIFFSMKTVLADGSTDAQEKRTVRVSCGINNALYINDDGKVDGYCSEYLTQLARINNWDIEYVEASWNDSVQNLYDGKIDLLFPTQMTEERKKLMGFSTAIGGYQPIGLFAKGDSKLCYDDFENFDGVKIAVSTGTSNEAALKAYATENDFAYTPVYMNTTEEKIKALQDGTVDMIVFSTLNDVQDGKVVAMLDYLPFYYATRKDDHQLLKELNYGMNQLLIRNPELVQNVFYNFMNRDISFAYTRDEMEAIQKKGKIVVGVYKDTAPLFDIDKNGNYNGIYVDLLERIHEISGLEFEIKAIDRKKYAFDVLEEGTIDFLMGVSDQAIKYTDKDDYNLSEGIMDYYTVRVTESDFEKKDTAPIVFALTSARKYWSPIIERDYPKANFIYCENSKECLEAVQQGKAEATLLNTWEYNYQSKNTKFQNMIEWENSRTLSSAVFISKKSQEAKICSVMNKSIEQISNEEKEAIITGNLNRAYSSYDLSDTLYSMKNTIFIFGCVLFVIISGFIVFVIIRRRATRQLEVKNMQLQEANDAKTKFLSRMSHELRTPLNAIAGYATVTKQNVALEKINRDVLESNQDAILRATKYQLAIIGDLLDIQKIESDKIELSYTEVDFDDYMEELVEMIQIETKEKNIDFSYQRLTKVNDTYLIDAVRFQQVLLNLLHNAIKFTPAGGSVKLTAEVIDLHERANTLKFVIADTGIGMTQDFQDNYLFQRFAQEYQGNTSPYEGCGMGLAISRELIHLMGGEITCVSEQGVGSTFTVIITAEHIGKNKKRRKRQAVNYDLGGIRILLCEDNPMNQDMEKKVLERMNCKVDIAEDGQIGLETFVNSSNGYYDIVLMDIRMPHMDGLETTRAIRALDREDAKVIPILAVSANAFDEDVQASLEAGMNEHIAKPIDARLIYQKLQEYCKTGVKE